MATRPFLVVILSREPPFLATRLFLVIILRRKSLVFSDETFSRRRFWAGNSFF
ncbi:hypothetical protein NSQ96_04475 [Caldifermentibacillus hisashii]|uniref:hypothetical protein n=1 Tax=Caldifermentibacillus hisashii TaxID=996558 RepID=UPI0031FCE5D2